MKNFILFLTLSIAVSSCTVEKYYDNDCCLPPAKKEVTGQFHQSFSTSIDNITWDNREVRFMGDYEGGYWHGSTQKGNYVTDHRDVTIFLRGDGISLDFISSFYCNNNVMVLKYKISQDNDQSNTMIYGIYFREQAIDLISDCDSCLSTIKPFIEDFARGVN